jgi:toxin ParE1/3/4
MVGKVTWSAQSLEDVDAIYDYVADLSLQNADMLVQDIHAVCEKLGNNPLIGRPRPELLPGLRSWNLYRFVVFYLPSEPDSGIGIARILHSAMEIGPSDFGDGETGSVKH